MATGVAVAVANAILDSYCRGVAWTPPAAFWVKLHTGDPGAAGAANAATETDRVQGTFSVAAAGAITNSADLEWLAVAGTETYSHVSFWDAAAAGTFLGSDDLAVARSVLAGDNFTISAGELDINITAIAA